MGVPWGGGATVWHADAACALFARVLLRQRSKPSGMPSPCGCLPQLLERPPHPHPLRLQCIMGSDRCISPSHQSLTGACMEASILSHSPYLVIGTAFNGTRAVTGMGTHKICVGEERNRPPITWRLKPHELTWPAVSGYVEDEQLRWANCLRVSTVVSRRSGVSRVILRAR